MLLLSQTLSDRKAYFYNYRLYLLQIILQNITISYSLKTNCRDLCSFFIYLEKFGFLLFKEIKCN